MLLNYTQFLIRQGVRSPMHLSNPRVLASADVALPRESVVHYLSYADDTLFPSRSLNYLGNVKLNKRVPVHNVIALDTTSDTTMIANRTLDKQMRAWRKDNNQHFKLVDLFLTPNSDIQTHAVINYQNLKGLYSYKSNAVAELSRYRNVYSTYWASVHRAVAVSPNAEHFVRIDVPSLIPSKALLDNLLKYPETTYARVVRDPGLNSVIQLYQYLGVASRERSTMAALTEEDCNHITVELVHQGHSCFFKLGFLLSLSEESSLPSKRKLNLVQLQRLYLVMVLKMQKKVYDLQNDEHPDTQGLIEDEAYPEDGDEPDDMLEDGGVDARVKLVENTAGIRASTAVASKQDPLALLDEKDLPGASEDSFDMALTSDISEFEGGADDLFTRLMTQAEPTAKDSPSTSDDDATDASDAAVGIAADYSAERKAALLETRSLDQNFEAYIAQAKLSGAVNTAELRSLKKLFEQRKTMKSPYNDTPIDAHKVVNAEDVSLPAQALEIAIDNNLVDDELKSETLFNFDRLYIDKLLQKDVLGCVTQIEEAGVIIKDYQVERNDSALGSYEVHKLTLKPYKGKESTVYFRLPVINEEGEFTASGIRYRMRKQRQDQSIRKISPSKVALTTNYGKLFVERTERKTYDSYAQVSEYIKKDYLASGDIITSITPGNCFNNYASRPNMLMAMSLDFKQFSTKAHTFIFDPVQGTQAVKQEVIEEIERGGKFFFLGFNNKDKSLLVMDLQDKVYNHNDLTTPIGDLPSLLQMDASKIPVQFATVKVLGDTLALGPVMAYYLGLKGLLEATDTRFEVLGPRKQTAVSADTVVLRLSDCKLVIAADTPLKKLLFGGFAFYKDTLKTLPLESLEDKGVYLSLFEQRGSSLMHLRELDLLRQLFLDPISKDVLRSAGEPDAYIPLMLRACEMLGDFKHPDINDPEYSRIRGYDRVPGLMYRILSQSVRTTKMGMSKGKIELDPYGVWNAITQDTTVKIVEDSNPITDVKETEALTFTGADGLSKGSTPEKMRRYHKNDIGLVSEATVDSSDVALNIYLSPYAKLENLRGKVGKREQTRQDTVFSTSVHLTPMGEQDDPKRVN